MTTEKPQAHTVDHLQMADDALRYTRDGDGPDMPVMAIGHALVALVERVDQGLQLLTDIAQGLERQWWSTLTPDQREAELKFDELRGDQA